MTAQSRRLRRLLKEHGITDVGRAVPRVRTTRTPAGEWGPARATCKLLTPDQIAALRVAEPHIEIFNYPGAKFSVIYT